MNTNERLIKISETIKELGVSPVNEGYTFLREAIGFVMENPSLIHNITKELYPMIAKRYNTTKNAVERLIRFSIDKSYNRAHQELWESMFKYSQRAYDGKATNGEFIATVADYLLLREN